MTTMLLPTVGKPAPDFTLPSTSGDSITLKSFKGKKTVVLYFYSKDETPGCTREACDIRDHHEELDKYGVVVLGVSTDSMEAHMKFKEKHKLPFTLLSDPDHTMMEKYNAWVEKSMYGKKYMGVERATFLIDGKGRVARVWRKVTVPGHAEEVLAAAKVLK